MNVRKRSSLGILFLLLIAPCAVFGDELDDRARIRNEVATLVTNEDFSKLESMADTYRTSKSRTSSGIWHLTIFYSGIYSAFNIRNKDPAFWSQAEQLMKRWLAAYPSSTTAPLAYARMLRNHGWSIRGGGYANTVESQNWKPFREYNERARAYLEKYKEIASRDPYWYALMAEIATVQEWHEAEFERLIAEGLQREPLFYQLYFAAIDYYAPKWGGTAEAVEKFARQAVTKTKASEGFGMYARTYWYASETQYDDRLFSDSLVDWLTMKKGIDDILKKYPDSWNINNFAKFACLSRDKAKTASLIAQIDAAPIMAVWKNATFFKQCKLWASSV
jgi:hypothetical protein